MTRRHAPRLSLGALAISLASVLGGHSLAHAQEAVGDGVRSEVFVVLASEEEGTIDPSLAEIPALRQPPFNAFHTMSVLSRTNARLSADRPLEVTLPNGRQLRIELERPMPDGRHRVRISINTPGQSDYLPLLQIVASPGDPFFVAGQNWQGGTLVIGVRIGTRPAARKPG